MAWGESGGHLTPLLDMIPSETGDAEFEARIRELILGHSQVWGKPNSGCSTHFLCTRHGRQCKFKLLGDRVMGPWKGSRRWVSDVRALRKRHSPLFRTVLIEPRLDFEWELKLHMFQSKLRLILIQSVLSSSNQHKRETWYLPIVEKGRIGIPWNSNDKVLPTYVSKILTAPWARRYESVSQRYLKKVDERFRNALRIDLFLFRDGQILHSGDNGTNLGGMAPRSTYEENMVFNFAFGSMSDSVRIVRHFASKNTRFGKFARKLLPWQARVPISILRSGGVCTRSVLSNACMGY